MLKNRKKIALLVVFLGLVGCAKHTNPLMKVTHKKAALFLVHASQYAEKQLKIYQPPGGTIYGQCMEGSAENVNCERLYRSMLQYGKLKPEFKALTLLDLKNTTMWDAVKDSYNRESFDAI